MKMKKVGGSKQPMSSKNVDVNEFLLNFFKVVESKLENQKDKIIRWERELSSKRSVQKK